MYSCVVSGGTSGSEVYLMRVETDISEGLPGFNMVGSLSASVREASDRVRVALKNNGIRLPPLKITVSFSPADIPKRSVVPDLPVAVGIMICLGMIRQDAVRDMLIVGELSLDGEIKPVRGVLPVAEEAARSGIKCMLAPRSNAREGALVSSLDVVGFSNLQEIIMYLNASENRRAVLNPPVKVNPDEIFQYQGDWHGSDFSDVRGQQGVKRVLEIAAAGSHNALMSGPPGAGKSMLAACLPGILPPLSASEGFEITRIYSIAGQLEEERPLITKRPFLSPHHTITKQALCGGGVVPMPGVISLAHRGVLFLDELPEFSKETLNGLREPMEEHHITISRTTGTAVYPARALFLAAANPCPCGFYPGLRCNCTKVEVQRYARRIPGPIRDRIDLFVHVPQTPVQELIDPGKKEESSSVIRERVIDAYERQQRRFAGTEIQFNAEIPAKQIDDYCTMDQETKSFIRHLFEQLDMTARSFHRTLRVARTIADLAGSENIEQTHIAEAVSYREVIP